MPQKMYFEVGVSQAKKMAITGVEVIIVLWWIDEKIRIINYKIKNNI